MKSALFAGHKFTRERDNEPYLKVYMNKTMLLIYRMTMKMASYGG
jgi:hypothetical protein